MTTVFTDECFHEVYWVSESDRQVELQKKEIISGFEKLIYWQKMLIRYKKKLNRCMKK